MNHQILISSLQDLGVSGSALTRSLGEDLCLNLVLSLLGSLRVPSWVPSSSLSALSFTQMAFPTTATLMTPNWSSLSPKLKHRQQQESLSVWLTPLTGCLHTSWKLILIRPNYFSCQGEAPPTQDLTITSDNSVLGTWVWPSTANSPLTANITATTRSCRFMLYNIRRIRPLLTQEAEKVLVQVLVQALVISRLDYCPSLLAGRPAAAIRPLQQLDWSLTWVHSHSSAPFTGYQWLPASV